MLKKFKELYKVDTKAYHKLKPTFSRKNGKMVKNDKKYWLDYIEWATVLVLLYDNGAENVSYGVDKTPDGYPVFYDATGNNPFLNIIVVIDGDTHTLTYPVMSMRKDVVTVMDIHTSMQRGFVKCVAINTGLGLSLWQKEEQNFNETITEEELNGSRIKELNEQIVHGFNDLVKLCGDVQQAHEMIGSTKAMLTKLVNGKVVSDKELMAENIKGAIAEKKGQL